MQWRHSCRHWCRSHHDYTSIVTDGDWRYTSGKECPTITPHTPVLVSAAKHHRHERFLLVHAAFCVCKQSAACCAYCTVGCFASFACVCAAGCCRRFSQFGTVCACCYACFYVTAGVNSPLYRDASALPALAVGVWLFHEYLAPVIGIAVAPRSLHARCQQRCSCGAVPAAQATALLSRRSSALLGLGVHAFQHPPGHLPLRCCCGMLCCMHRAAFDCFIKACGTLRCTYHAAFYALSIMRHCCAQGAHRSCCLTGL